VFDIIYSDRIYQNKWVILGQELTENKLQNCVVPLEAANSIVTIYKVCTHESLDLWTPLCNNGGNVQRLHTYELATSRYLIESLP
jgi:hypothetical protein